LGRPSWNHRPEEEGITTCAGCGRGGAPSVGITALKKKGLRLNATTDKESPEGWNHRPEEEGITTVYRVIVSVTGGWNHRPEEEGITTWLVTWAIWRIRWNHRPEEEGITTLVDFAMIPSAALESPP